MNNDQYIINEKGVLYFTDDCKTIKSNQFKGNLSIRKIIISKNIKSIHAKAFSMCSNVEEINVDCDNKKYYCPDGSNSIVERNSNILIFGCSNTIVSKSVSEIGPFAFCGQNRLKKIVIPSNVKKLSPYAFDGCSSMIEVVMNDGLEEIGECCFKSCYKLETIHVPKTLKKIDNTAFSLIYGYCGIIDDGCTWVNTIYFSGLKENFYNTFNVNKLFIIDLNLRNHDMVINCEDGVLVLSYDDDWY